MAWKPLQMAGARPIVSKSLTEFGAVSDEQSPGFDSYAALQAAVNECSDAGIELIIPVGTFNISQAIVSTKSKFFIRGYGTASRIKTTSNTINAFTLGPGALGSGLEPTGYLSSFVVTSVGKSPATNSIGVFLKGLRHFKLEEMHAENFTVGFDMIDNCYGTKFYGCRTVFDECKVGLILRGAENGGTTWGSGSDIPFYDCWFHGVDGGVWIHPDGTGYHFYGGQITGGSSRTADADGFGSVVIGKNYYTGAVGTVGTVDFNGVDFEGAQRMWQIRAYGRANVAFRSCALLATNASQKALGVLKIDTAENGTWKFSDNNVNGDYSQGALVAYSGHGSAFTIREEGTLPGTACFANSVQMNAGQTLLQQSNLNIGASFGRVGGFPFHGLGRGRLRWNDTTGRFEVAGANGGTGGITGFFPMLQQVAVPATATAAGQIGDFAFDASFLYICHAVNTWRRVATVTW